MIINHLNKVLRNKRLLLEITTALFLLQKFFNFLPFEFLI